MVDLPSFGEFYAAVHGREPFPWQTRLATRVVDVGWPSAIGVPTGMGKTACLDIAVWSLAAQAHLAPADRTVPTRIWYVVNRRLLVDAAADHAERLARLLTPASGEADQIGDPEAVRAIAEALRTIGAYGSEQGALHVTRLRGGADLGARVPDPSQPALVLATVPMFASRWLFRGFGSSRSMRPIDAAHAGIDSLVLLDEAHLARSLARLADPLAECDPGEPSLVIPAGRSRPRLVALTATGEPGPDRFDLDETDRAHEIIRARLKARKPTKLVDTSTRQLAATMATQVSELVTEAGRPVACVAFANSPATARAVFANLSDSIEDAEVVLVTGRTRDREADTLRARLLDGQIGAPAGRSLDVPRARHLVVVATQTLEVGADLDFDRLVTETASVRAVVQRFGRLNRLARRDEIARAVICHPLDRKPSPLYREEPTRVWDRLQAAVDRHGTGELDLCPAAVSDLLGEPGDEPPAAAELLPVHVWEWAKTSQPPAGEAPGHPFYEGLDAGPPTVTVLWRAHVPPSGGRLLPPLRGDEGIEIPIWEVNEAIGAERVETVRRVQADGVTVEAVGPEGLRPGDQVLLTVDDGLYDIHGWNPAGTERVLDVSFLRDRVLPLDPEAVPRLLDATADTVTVHALVDRLASGPDDDEDGWDDTESALVAELLGELRGSPHHPWLSDAEWHEFLDAMEALAADPERRNPLVTRPVDAVAFIAAPKPGRSRLHTGVRADAFDELSFAETVASPGLDDHQVSVGEIAADIARHIGVPSDVVAAVRRAGQAHDTGKADPRFQRWLDPYGDAPGLLAKSSMPWYRREAARQASGWPRGGRHELLSARMLADALPAGDPARDLVLHLAASHHGHGRPSIPVVADATPTKVTVEIGNASVRVTCDLSDPDWDQPARFRRLCERYGYWGLALLEAVLRQADHVASAVSAVGRDSEVM